MYGQTNSPVFPPSPRSQQAPIATADHITPLPPPIYATASPAPFQYPPSPTHYPSPSTDSQLMQQQMFMQQQQQMMHQQTLQLMAMQNSGHQNTPIIMNNNNNNNQPMGMTGVMPGATTVVMVNPQIPVNHCCHFCACFWTGGIWLPCWIVACCTGSPHC